MGCLSRLGCLVVLLVALGAGYWLYGDRLPGELGSLAGRAARAVTKDTTRVDRERGVAWVSLDESSTAGIENVARLGRASGPAFVTLSANDLAGFISTALARFMPRSAVAPQVAVSGDRVLMRAEVDLRDFAGEGAFGSIIGSAMNGRDTLRLGGTLRLVRPGLAEYRVRELRIKGIDVPPRVIPGLVGTLKRRVRGADSLSSDALPVPLPRYVGDVRVQNGRITLYRAGVTP